MSDPTTLSGSAVAEVAVLAERAAQIQTIKIGDYTYGRDGEGGVARINTDPELPGARVFWTLGGFARYVQEEPECAKALIHVVSPTTVEAISLLEGQDKARRRVYAAAQCKPAILGFQFNQLGSLEGLAIALQTCFAPTIGDIDELRKFCSSVRSSASVGVADDGVSQTVEAKRGIAAVLTTTVKNPWSLAPWRTFAELQQPPSYYVLRFAEREQPTAGLFETGDQSWLPDAVGRTRNWLGQALGPGWPVLG